MVDTVAVGSLVAVSTNVFESIRIADAVLVEWRVPEEWERNFLGNIVGAMARLRSLEEGRKEEGEDCAAATLHPTF